MEHSVAHFYFDLIDLNCLNYGNLTQRHFIEWSFVNFTWLRYASENELRAVFAFGCDYWLETSSINCYADFSNVRLGYDRAPPLKVIHRPYYDYFVRNRAAYPRWSLFGRYRVMGLKPIGIPFFPYYLFTKGPSNIYFFTTGPSDIFRSAIFSNFANETRFPFLGLCATKVSFLDIINNAKAYLFTFGFVILDLNYSLLLTYSYILVKISRFCFGLDLDFFMIPLNLLLLQLTRCFCYFFSFYNFAYNTWGFFGFLTLSIIIFAFTSLHFYRLFYLIINSSNLFKAFYSFFKHIIFIFFQSILSFLFFLLFILSRIYKIIKIKKIVIKRSKSWYGIIYHYIVNWLYEIWNEGDIEPFGGILSERRYLWTYPFWMFIAELTHKQMALLDKIKALNMWTNIKLMHKQNIGLKEKKWWNFLTTWQILHALRYYYFFIYFFLVGKIFRLIYFFFVFSFKYFFFLFLKHVLEFAFVFNTIEVFLFYYIQLLILSRKLLSPRAYKIILKLFAFIKAKLIFFFTLDLHYYLYKFAIFFRPQNYGFMNDDFISDYPFGVSSKNLKRLFWVHSERNFYESPYFLTFLKYQSLIFFSLCSVVNFIFGYFLENFFKHTLPWLKKKGLSENTLGKIKFAFYHIYYNFLLAKIFAIKYKFSSLKFLKKFSFLRASAFFFFILALILLVIFLTFSIIKLFLALASYFFYIILLLIFNFKEAIFGLCNGNYYLVINELVKILCAFFSFLNFCNVFKFANFYIIYFMLFFACVKIADKKLSLTMTAALVDLILWYIGFFFWFFYSLCLSLLCYVIKVIYKLKLWAWLLIILILAFDDAFLFNQLIQPFFDFFLSLTIQYSYLMRWVLNISDIGYGYTTKWIFGQWLVLYLKWDLKAWPAMNLADVYFKLANSYFSSDYWNREWIHLKILYGHWKEDKFVLTAITLIIPFTDLFGTWEGTTNLSAPTFIYIPKAIFLTVFYSIKSFLLCHFQGMHIYGFKNMILYDLILILRAFLIKLKFEIIWFIAEDLPHFYGYFFDNSIYYNALNNIRKNTHLTFNMAHEAIDLLKGFWHWAIGMATLLSKIFVKTWLLMLKIFKLIPVFFADLLNYYNLSFFLLSDFRNFSFYFFFKTLNLVNFYDIHWTSFHRENLFKYNQYIEGNFHHDMFTIPKASDYALNYFELWAQDPEHFTLPQHGLLDNLWTFQCLGPSPISWIYTNLRKERLNIDTALPLMRSFVDRSSFFYDWFTFVLLILVLYLFFIKILGLFVEEAYLDYNKQRLWTFIREENPKSEKNFKWVDSFSFLSFYHISQEVYAKLKTVELGTFGKKQYEKILLSNSKNFFYSYYRYYLTIVKLASKFSNSAKRGWRLKLQYRYLKFHEKRLFGKLSRFVKRYKGNKRLFKSLEAPFDYKKLFYSRDYKDYYSFSIDFDWVLIKFYEYKRKNILRMFSKRNYMSFLPLKNVKEADVLYLQKRLKDIFNFWHTLDKVFLMNKGPIFLFHNDKGSDFLSYNKNLKEANQIMQNPKVYNFDLDLIIWEIPLIILYNVVLYTYFYILPVVDIETDEWGNYQIFLIRFLENIDLFHNLLSFFIGSYIEPDHHYWWSLEDRDLDVSEEDVWDQNYQMIKFLGPTLSYYFTLPDYWIQSSLHIFRYNDFDLGYSKDLDLGYAKIIDCSGFRYILRHCYLPLVNFFNDSFYNFSVLNIKSLPLFVFAATKYILYILFIIYFVIKKYFKINAKKKIFNIYVETAGSILNLLNISARAKAIRLFLYFKKL